MEINYKIIEGGGGGGGGGAQNNFGDVLTWGRFDFATFWLTTVSLSGLFISGRRKTSIFSKKAMQSFVNTVKGTALGVAEYLTPVLKVANITKHRLLQISPKEPVGLRAL